MVRLVVKGGAERKTQPLYVLKLTQACAALGCEDVYFYKVCGAWGVFGSRHAASLCSGAPCAEVLPVEKRSLCKSAACAKVLPVQECSLCKKCVGRLTASLCSRVPCA